MIRFKNHRNLKEGVTFIEIMLTIFMMGMILSSAFVAQSTILTHISDWSRSLRAVLQLRETIVHVAQDRLQGTTHPKEEKKGHMTITYAMERPKKESALAKLQSLYVERVSSQWGQDKETVIALLYKPEVKKK